MKKIIPALIVALLASVFGYAQTDAVGAYQKKSYMIPMRDGVKLYTVVFSPVNPAKPSPILIQRTPYGAEGRISDDSIVQTSDMGSLFAMAREGYIFVYQDVRGKYKSEGTMQIHLPVNHVQKKGAIDESTDTWDSVDWLIKNLKDNNGKAGIYGISYPGWLALVGAIDPHPALKAASEQACMGDLFLGDDFHHNGAFRLSYGFEYTYAVEGAKTAEDFSFPQYDLYDWYLKLGSLKNVNDKYFHQRIPTWNSFVEHPHYDEYWQSNSPLSYTPKAEIPQLHVGGYYDQEDVNGPQLMYAHMEKNDNDSRNFLVLGPWYHGQWGGGKGDSIGKINLQRRTSEDFLGLQKKWFDYWLKGIGDGKFDEATCFQTGSNQWKTYSTWPPKEAAIRKLYAQANQTASFSKPAAAAGYTSYISDPAHPVPYRPLPIEETYSPGSRWRTWHVDDQRFVYTRPDVLHFTMDAMTSDLAVTGKIRAHLYASTSGTDADWIVKLIDVYPAIDTASKVMSGYQLPVAMEVFRGSFRKSFSKPSALVPNQPEEFIIDLHDINHVFKKGHQIMIEVQSSWFPVIDRNPQKFVPNIYLAKDADYIKAEHRIYHNSKFATYLELPVLE